MKKYLYILLFGCLVESSQAGIFGPSNYDECVLDSMKGVTSNSAAVLIARSCRQKYPENKVQKNIRQLSNVEVPKLTGRGGPSGNYYSIDILNSNSSVTVTQVTIAIETKIGGKASTNYYDSDVTIGPNKTADIFFKFIQGDSGAKYEWSIFSAKGY